MEVCREVGLDLHAARGGLLALEHGHRVRLRSRFGEPVDERVEGVVVRGGERARVPTLAAEELVHRVLGDLVRLRRLGRGEPPRRDLATQRLDLRVERLFVAVVLVVGVRGTRRGDGRESASAPPREAPVVVVVVAAVAAVAVGVAEDGGAPARGRRGGSSGIETLGTPSVPRSSGARGRVTGDADLRSTEKTETRLVVQHFIKRRTPAINFNGFCDTTFHVATVSPDAPTNTPER